MLYFADNTLAGAADTADVVQPELRSAGELGPQLPVTEALRRLDTVIPGIAVKFARRLSLDPGGNRLAIAILVYDRGMPVSVNLQTVHPRKLAAVRREVAPGAVGSAWGPALGKVWEFIRSRPGLRTDGHNIFLYHHPAQPGAPILCDFGVEVTRTFETAGEVYATETQGGEAAVAVHRGPYNRMNEAHDAIRKWMAANRRESAGHSWEIYGDPAPDPAETETTVVYLLK